MTRIYLKDNNVVVFRDSKIWGFIPTRMFSIEPEENYIYLAGKEKRLSLRYDEVADESGNTFATPNEVIDYLSPFVGFNSGGNSGANPSGKTFEFTASNFTDLQQTPGTTVGQLGFAFNSQGTKWLPGTIGGTYYPSGTYVWDGTDWVSNRNEIASELQDLQPEINTITVLANDEIQTTLDTIDFVSAFIEVQEPGPQITATGVIDNTNVSTGEANLINGNLTDLTYNNSNAGTANKELPGINIGSQQSIAEVVLYWWNNTYTASNYKIQGSNDGNNWVDIATNLDSTGIVGTANNPQRIPVSANFQYIRPFCVQGNNTSWCVVSELQVFEAGDTVIKEVCTLEDIELIDVNGKLKVKNVGSTNANLNIITR